MTLTIRGSAASHAGGREKLRRAVQNARRIGRRKQDEKAFGKEWVVCGKVVLLWGQKGLSGRHLASADQAVPD